MRKPLIVAPWLPALCGAAYVYGQWDHLPARIAVTFFQGSPSGWNSKSAALSLILGLMFGLLAVFTAILVMPDRVRERPPAAVSLMGSATAALADGPSDHSRRLRLIMTAHWVVGFLIPLSLWHVVSWNLHH